MAGRFVISTLGIAAIGLVFAAGAARADAIDGNWCFTDGKSFSILGPDIVTPAGTRLKGDYRRHAFAYKIPASEPGAGGTVSMLLLDENTVELTRGGISETWRRCQKPVS
jgi:hypothetical protein